MVHILEGNSELGTHLWSEKGDLICFIRLFMPTAVSKRVLSYHLIQVPWNTLESELPSNIRTMEHI